MWTRAELKLRGQSTFQRNYGVTVLVTIIMGISSGFLNNSSRGGSQASTMLNSSGQSSDVNNGLIFTLFSTLFGLSILTLSIIFTLLKVFIGNLLIVGGKRFFMENRHKNAPLKTLQFGIKSNKYGKIVLTMFLKDLYIILWTCLFVIPGLIKYYEYRMVPYLLSENPQLSREEVFGISRHMMNGQKMNAFILDISFWGWNFLSLITCGIAGIFFTNPYIEATYAELYAVLRSNALNIGFLSINELPGFDY